MHSVGLETSLEDLLFELCEVSLKVGFDRLRLGCQVME